MGKKIKLNLEDLKVQSFVTSLNKDEKIVLKGGESKLTTPQTYICSDFCSYIGLCW